MFNLILADNKQLLIKGHFGFSKTFSAMLYSILIDYVVNYRIKYPEHA
jgi:hypothetical protein